VDKMKIDSVDHVAIQNAQYVAQKRLQQERLEEHYANKNRIQEHHNKKINLDKRMLEAYYAVLDRLQTYNQQKQLERAKAEQGKFLDIEVK
tara:strand:- start:30 stop:302 length:273 start_codon:yes stop_codon:yes gene_type:complete